MSITAIIPHYWDSRIPNLPLIVRALLDGVLPPERIIIWNNTPEVLAVDGAYVINAGRNWGIAARYGVAYLVRTEFIFFQDNDLLVEPETLRNMRAYSEVDANESVELQGRMLDSSAEPYSRSSYVSAEDIDSPRVVDIGLSRLSLMTRTTAMKLATKISPDVTDDDIWTSRHCWIRVVPAPPGARYVNLTETEGLSQDAVAHVRRRDGLIRQLWPHRGAA